MNENVTISTETRIKNWASSVNHVGRLKRELSNAETNLFNEINELGKWLTPIDAKEGDCPLLYFPRRTLLANRSQESWRSYKEMARKWLVS